jgi:hypothetical protein
MVDEELMEIDMQKMVYDLVRKKFYPAAKPARPFVPKIKILNPDFEEMAKIALAVHAQSGRK